MGSAREVSTLGTEELTNISMSWQMFSQNLANCLLFTEAKEEASATLPKAYCKRQHMQIKPLEL